jgi:3-hydroxy acid dehydrogenase / malonic semialdehyde reductase
MKVTQFKGKTAIVTGASGGIGSAISKSLAENGCALLVCGRQPAKLQALAKELKGSHQVEVETASFDVGSLKECQKALEKYQEFSQASSILVNAAGIGQKIAKFQDLDLESLDQIIDTNLKGLLYMTRLLLPQLIANKKGHIVNIGSVSGKWPYPRNVAYNASKSALLAASESLRLDLMGTDVRVTTIEPGLFYTDLIQGRFDNQEKTELTYRGTTLLQPADVADSVIWSLTRPPTVNVQEIVLFPTDQAGVGYLSRKSKQD